MFTDTGWMIAAIAEAAEPPKMPLVAYHGSYTVVGDVVTTRIEAATNASWIGGAQVRTCRFEGESRMILSATMHSAVYGETVRLEFEWQRLG